MFNKKLVYSMFIAGAALIPAYVVTVQAEELVVADGTYEVNFLTYKTGTTETSGMANRFAQPATLIVEDGQARLQFEIITQNSMMGMMTIPYAGQQVEMTTIEGNIEATTRTVELPIAYFNEALTVNVDVVFPGSATPIKQTFDLIVESPVDESLVEEVALTAYKYGTIEPSLMQQFLMPTAKIILEDNHSIVQITFTNKDYVKSLIINGKPAEIVGEQGTTVTYAAKVTSTKQLIEATMDINANGMAMTQQAHLHLAVKGASLMIANPFKDIEGHENKAAILTLLNKGIVKSAEQFKPYASLTRSQFALMIARTLQLDNASDAGFKDLANLQNTDQERYNAINGLANAGVVMKQEQFKPNQPITRQQAALMIYRAMQYHVGTTALDFGNNIHVYADAAQVSNEEAQRALSFLYASNAMTGSVDNEGNRTIKPNHHLTRGQMAKILNGTLKYLGH